MKNLAFAAPFLLTLACSSPKSGPTTAPDSAPAKAAAADVKAPEASATAIVGRKDDGDRNSKNGVAEGNISGTKVTVHYGRPQVKGRPVWGGLVPYGQVWRTGADEANTITFSADVMVEGKHLPAGTYSLFTLPTDKTWTIIFNKVAQQWGAYKYDAAQDALRVEVTPVPHADTEALTIEVGADAVMINWEKLSVPFKVAAHG